MKEFSVFDGSEGPYFLLQQTSDTWSAETSRTRAFYALYGKRAFDLILALALLPVLVPLILCLWVIVRMDGGPGFFGHKRVGNNGVFFTCWKLRTMQVGAEAALKAHLAQNEDARREWERDHKLTDDPRVTRIGKFLRKTSLDELPQILNVVLGNMSFVGPRPVIEPEVARYGRYIPVYLRGKPGITGLWQVSGRNDLTYDERITLDVLYRDISSFWLDLRIIFKTALVVVRPTGR